MTKPTPTSRDDYAVFFPITTRVTDNDAYGHMNNAVHYQLFDTAVNTHLISSGMFDIVNNETVFLVAQTGCSYFSELAYPDVVTVGIKVAKLGRASVTYHLGLFASDSQVAAAQGHFVHVNVSREGHTPTPIDDKTRAFLAQIQ